eukprot:6229122-Pyramimonas_sp.AAC.1
MPKPGRHCMRAVAQCSWHASGQNDCPCSLDAAHTAHVRSANRLHLQAVTSMSLLKHLANLVLSRLGKRRLL